MNKKSYALLLAALTATAVIAPAQTATAPTPPPPAAPAPAAPADSSSWVITGSVSSQYMFRGVRLGGPAFEPSVEYDEGSLAVGVWCNTPISDKVVGQSDPEFDFYGSYSFETIKDTMTVVPGYTIYTYPNAKKANGFYKATVEPNIAINYTVGGVKLTPKVYYDFVLKGPTFEFGAAYTVPLKDMGTELDFTGTIGTFKWTSAVPDVSPDIKNWGNYWLAGVSLPFQVSKAGKLTIGWAYTKGSDNFFKQGTAPKASNSAAIGRGVGTISYSYTF